MAIYGCKHPVFAPISAYTPGSLPTYGTVINGVADAARITKVDISVDRADAKLAGDNATCERDNSVTGGSVTTGLTHLTDNVRETVLGMLKKGDAAPYAFAMSDAATPYVGFGCVLNEIVEGVKSYRGIWVYRTQFAASATSAETKGDGINFQTGEITGAMLDVEDGTNKLFYVEKSFSTEAAAIAFVDGKGV